MGDQLLESIITSLYNGELPIPALNHIFDGRSVHPLSHYLSYFLSFYQIAFVALVAFIAYCIIPRHLPDDRKIHWLSPLMEGVVITSFAAFLLLRRISFPVGFYDEGVILSGAWQFSLGAIPYRDFYNIYGPGQVAILGALFALFGKSLFIARIYDCSIRIGLLLVVWGVLQRRVRPATCILVHIALTCWIYYFGYSLYPVYPTLLFQLASILILLSPDARLRLTRYHFWAGILSGTAILFRHDAGTLFAMLLLATLWLPAFVPGTPASRLHPAVAFLFGALFLPLLIYGSLSFFVPLSVLWRQLVEMPFCVFPAYRTLPYPSPVDLISSPLKIAPFYLFPGLFLCGLTFLFRRARVARPRRAVVFLVILATSFIPQLLGRSDICHLLPFALSSISLFFFSIPRRYAFPVSIVFLIWTVIYYPIPHRPEPPDVTQLQNAVLQCSPGPVFIGNRFHDSLSINHAGLYFLLDRRPGTYYYWFDPGVVTTAPVQTAIVGELETNRVKTVILWDEPPHNEPNRSSEDAHIGILDSYIRSHYHLSGDFPPYSLWTSLPIP